ncbi:MAG: hypothetical protein LBS50_07490 [Prevotellaceae bacterium]|nr:hypothetical protein [Prevotellaceae bacterium]
MRRKGKAVFLWKSRWQTSDDNGVNWTYAGTISPLLQTLTVKYILFLFKKTGSASPNLSIAHANLGIHCRLGRRILDQ